MQARVSIHWLSLIQAVPAEVVWLGWKIRFQKWLIHRLGKLGLGVGFALYSDFGLLTANDKQKQWASPKTNGSHTAFRNLALEVRQCHFYHSHRLTQISGEGTQALPFNGGGTESHTVSRTVFLPLFFSFFPSFIYPFSFFLSSFPSFLLPLPLSLLRLSHYVNQAGLKLRSPRQIELDRENPT